MSDLDSRVREGRSEGNIVLLPNGWDPGTRGAGDRRRTSRDQKGQQSSERVAGWWERTLVREAGARSQRAF